jgi:RHS repeat-associated protein
LSFLFVLLAGAALATVPRRPDSSSFAARCCADYRALDRFAGSQQVCTFEPTSTLNGGGVNTNVGYYYSQDNLGSSTVLSDPNGVRVEINAFYPFGRSQTANPQAGFQVSRRFTGQVFDGETGLYYYNARYYDPELGRFIQPDNAIPDLSNPQSYNRYSYCLNNPLRFTDPTGHAAEDVEVEPRVDFITQEILSGQRASRAEMGLRTSVAISSEIRIAGAPVRNGPVRATISEQGELWAADPAEYAPKPAPAPVPQVNPEVRSAPTGNISQNAPAQQLEFTLPSGTAKVAPAINPSEVAGKTPAEIDALAKEKGLIPKGPDPMNGQGAYVDPVTGEQRILSHPKAEPPHAHVNDPSGGRLDINGNHVQPESPDAHLPIGGQQ